MAGAGRLKHLVTDELTQLSDEGKAIDIKFWREKIDALDFYDKEQLLDIYNQIINLPQRPDYPYTEPSELEEIFAESDIASIPDDKYQNVDLDYFHGAWLGRCIGCALGQPCESWQSQKIIDWYKNANKYPIKGYFPTVSGNQRNEGLATDELIKGMPIDDDTRFTVLNYLLVKDKGVNFDSWDVGFHWLRKVPYHVIFTAEIQSYLNFVNVDECLYAVKPQNAAEILKREKVSTYLNPYREWIGAQIRADAFGYLAAGMPKLAAKMAYTDAAFTHTKNGIYGEMFFAALIAAAFTQKDFDKAFQTALAVIPKNSRFYKEAVWAKEIAESDIEREDLIKLLAERANKYHRVHTINNAAFCIAAMARYKTDFWEAVAFSVECGLDTDCNGATVGSVMGALLGARAIPNFASAPLQDTFTVGVYPYDNYSITKFACEVKSLCDKLNQ